MEQLNIETAVRFELENLFEKLNKGRSDVNGNDVNRQQCYKEISEIMQAQGLTFTSLYKDSNFSKIVKNLITSSPDIPCFAGDETWEWLKQQFYGEA